MFKLTLPLHGARGWSQGVDVEGRADTAADGIAVRRPSAAGVSVTCAHGESLGARENTRRCVSHDWCAQAGP